MEGYVAQSVRFRAYIRRLFMRSILAFIALMLVSYVVFVVFYYEVYVVRETEQECAAIAAVADAEWQRYDAGVQSLARTEDVRGALDGQTVTESYRSLYEFSFAGPLRADFALLREDGTVCASNLYAVNSDSFSRHDGIRRELLRLNRMPDAAVSSTVLLPLAYDQGAVYAFSAVVPSEDGGTAGYLVFALRTEAFHALAIRGGADQVVLMDPFDHVIFATNRLTEKTLGKFTASVEESGRTEIDGQPAYAAVQSCAQGRVRVVTMTSLLRQQQLAVTGAIFLFTLSVLLLLSMPMLTRRVTERSLRSVDGLLRAVRACRDGDMGPQDLPQSFYEFDVLYADYNAMLARIRRLLARNTELAERKRRMEVRQLKGQFNPHFVFNVMEALRYEILIDPKRASEMVVAFARLMRYGIRASGDTAELAVDIRYVEDYLALQKMRYGDRLTYDIVLPAQLRSCRVPKLLLQPIVENSIVHGLEQTRELRLRVECRAEQGDLLLCVIDDGPGMTSAKYTEICAMLASTSAEPEHIGLYNVHRVLRLLYGGAYGVTIVEHRNGLKVILQMPLQQGEEHG